MEGERKFHVLMAADNRKRYRRGEFLPRPREMRKNKREVYLTTKRFARVYSITLPST